MPPVHRIEVLGPGCPRCFETHRIVCSVVERAGVDVEVVKEESYERMAALGVVATPALAVDGALVFSGRVPGAEEVRQLLGLT